MAGFRAAALTSPPLTNARRCAIIPAFVRLPGGRAPKGVRKVRAAQGRVPGNTRRGRPQGKCNREIPHMPSGMCKGGKVR